MDLFWQGRVPYRLSSKVEQFMWEGKFVECVCTNTEFVEH